MELTVAPKQIQTISPQLTQAMELLQMNALELKIYLENAVQENPLLELEDAESDEAELLRQQTEWLQSCKDAGSGGTWNSEKQSCLNNRATCCRMEDTLAYSLRAQLHGMKLPRKVELAAEWVIENLDRNGWFVRDEGGCPFPLPLLELGIQAVQQMEPAGVGADGLRQCLLLQLECRGGCELEAAIVRECLEEMAQDHYNAIAKHLGVSQEKIRRACAVIRTLNPRPASGFDCEEEEQYICPDVILACRDGEYEVVLNEWGVPRLGLNDFYCQLLRDSDDSQVLDYLNDKIRHAKWLMQNVEQRRNTVLQCTQTILDMQSGFLLRGERLLPMTLQDIAKRLEIHESTVSRAIRGKYLQCDRGVFPMGKLFSRNLAKEEGGTLTAGDAKTMISDLVAGEDKQRPLSDQQLCEQMADRGIALSRRTVTKYRMELNIPSATGRRMMRCC